MIFPTLLSSLSPMFSFRECRFQWHRSKARGADDTHIHTPTHTDTHTHTRTHIHARTHPRTHTRTHVRTHARAHAQPRARTAAGARTHARTHSRARAPQRAVAASCCRIRLLHTSLLCCTDCALMRHPQAGTARVVGHREFALENCFTLEAHSALWCLDSERPWEPKKSTEATCAAPLPPCTAPLSPPQRRSLSADVVLATHSRTLLTRSVCFSREGWLAAVARTRRCYVGTLYSVLHLHSVLVPPASQASFCGFGRQLFVPDDWLQMGLLFVRAVFNYWCIYKARGFGSVESNCAAFVLYWCIDKAPGVASLPGGHYISRWSLCRGS